MRSKKTGILAVSYGYRYVFLCISVVKEMNIGDYLLCVSGAEYKCHFLCTSVAKELCA